MLQIIISEKDAWLQYLLKSGVKYMYEESDLSILLNDDDDNKKHHKKEIIKFFIIIIK